MDVLFQNGQITQCGVFPKTGHDEGRVPASTLRKRTRFRIHVLLGVLLLLAIAPRARASLALLLEQPYGKLGVVDPTGHSAIYLDHVCAETPLKLRPCGPGELGVVLSRYDGIDHYDWLAIPLIPYLYSVATIEDVPQSVDHQTERELRNSYRRRHLEAIAPDLPGGAAPPGNWYELLGSAFDRTIYGFQVKTTPDQDAELIALFNDRRNVERYNGLFRNCADFARVTINMFYPHAVRRNWIADFGLTSPKSVARGLAHFAHKHPEAGLSVFVIPQVKGDLPRSRGTEDVAEGLLKRYGLPLVALSPVTTGVMFVAYVGHGRFSMPKHAPPLNLEELEVQAEMMRPVPPLAAPDPPEVVLAAVAPPRTRAAYSPAVPPPPEPLPER